MFRTISLLFTVFILLFSTVLNAQQAKKPKVALVLSGGGAKGMAHIPLLQTLDSLGIVPDLIVGTSIGSVVGGFYAMGYSGDSIAAITQKADWDLLLGGKTALKDVSVEEKSEFGRYLVNFDIKNKKLKTTSSLLNDQHLREFLAIYTYPTFQITDFDALPIPYRSVTTDIVNAEEMVIDEGSLSLAMRASMSIPGVFSAVPYKDVLLVDGGVLNNFPVDIAKEWGADIIIGSDVGGGMKSKEQLTDITSLLFQTAMLVSNKKSEASRLGCDILIDHLPNLTHSTGDFNSSQAIYKEGIIGTQLQQEALVALSKKLQPFTQKKVSIPDVPEKVSLDTVVFSGVSAYNLPLVKSRANIVANKPYSVEELVKGIDHAMGTTLFHHIKTKTIQADGMLGLEIIGEEHANHQLKASLHHDSYRGTGVLLNYEGRNLLGASSRVLLSADITAQPRFRLQAQRQFGASKSWWWRSEAFIGFLEHNSFFNGEYADRMKTNIRQLDTEINRNLQALESYVGVGIRAEGLYVEPKANPLLIDNLLGLLEYTSRNLEIDAHYVRNTLNTPFFASKGEKIKVKFSRSLRFDVRSKYDTDGVVLLEGDTNGFSKFIFSYAKHWPLHEKASFILNGQSSFIFTDPLEEGTLDFLKYGYGSQFFLGGNRGSSIEDTFVFPGLLDNELKVNQLLKLHASLQWNPLNNIYITPHINYASVSNRDFKSFSKGVFSGGDNWQSLTMARNIVSVGTTTAYNSILGPVIFDVSWVNGINKVRSSFSVGFFMGLTD